MTANIASLNDLTPYILETFYHTTGVHNAICRKFHDLNPVNYSSVYNLK